MGTGHCIGCVHFVSLSVLLVTSHSAEVHNVFLHFIGLTSHGGLIHGKLGGLEDDTVDGVGHTVLNVDNVTDVEEVVVDLKDLSIAEDTALKIMVRKSDILFKSN